MQPGAAKEIMFRKTGSSHYFFACLFLCASLAGFAQTSSDFFDDTKLQDIRLTVAFGDWNTLRARYMDNTYFPATFQWGDTTLQIGIRSRGRGSRSGEKPNIYLNFDKYVKKQRFLGLETANLNSNNQDPSHLHNIIAFKLFSRMGLPAPRLALARLFVNDEYFGLYNLVETIDEHFLDRNFGESDGFLYEYKPNRVFNFEWLGSDPSLYSPNLFEPQTHEDDPDPQPIVDMVSAINSSSDAQFVDAVSKYINPDLFLTHGAIESVLSEIDGMLGGVYGMNNFDFYRFQNTTLHQMIVWDKDLTFSQTQRDILSGMQDNVLARRLYAIPKYRNIYVNALVTATTSLGTKGGWADQEVDRLYALIREAATTETHKQCITDSGALYACRAAEFEAGVKDMHDFIAARPGFVLSAVLNLPPLGTVVVPKIQDVRSAAPYSASSSLAPGSLATLSGSGFASAVMEGTLPLPRQLEDVYVALDGVRVPLLMVAPDQINFQVPWETATGNLPLTVSVKGQLSDAYTVAIESVSPAIFNVSREDGSLITRDSPASPGELLIVWATGLGPVRDAMPSGEPTPPGNLGTPELPAVQVNGTEAQVAFAGLSPGWIGLYQVNVFVPSGVPSGASVPLELVAGGQTVKIDLYTR